MEISQPRKETICGNGTPLAGRKNPAHKKDMVGVPQVVARVVSHPSTPPSKRYRSDARQRATLVRCFLFPILLFSDTVPTYRHENIN